MKDGFIRLALVLDRSGSMASIEEATVAGVNKFIEEQKQVPGTATLKLAQFDDVYEEVFDTAIAEAPELTLSKTPREGQKTYYAQYPGLLFANAAASGQAWLRWLLESLRDADSQGTNLIPSHPVWTQGQLHAFEG